MNSVAKVYEFVEDREQNSEDASFSEMESNFDEGDFEIIDDGLAPVLPSAEQYYLTCVWVRPALPTIFGERTDDIVTDDISRRTTSSLRNRFDGRSSSCGEFSKTQFSLRKHVHFRAVTSSEGSNKKESAFTNLTNKQNNEFMPSSTTLRTTPQRYSSKALSFITTNGSPNPNSNSTRRIQLITPVSVVRRVTENFHEATITFPERDMARKENRAVEDQSAGEVTNPTIISAEKIRSILKSQPGSSSPRTLMMVLDEYKRNRVKARRACDNLPPQRNTNSSPISSQFHEVDRAKNVWVIRVYKNVNTESAGTAIENTNHQHPCSREKPRCEKPQYSRPCSARPSSSLSTNAGVRCSPQMSTDVAKRSVLYIPQLEVAFGFVAIGDAAVSTVNVTNRTDRSIRLRVRLSHSGTPFALLDSQILILDARRTTSLRIEFSPTQNARFCTSLLICVEGGGGPQVKYRMPVRGLGGAAVVTVKARDNLLLSRNGTYTLQSSYESIFFFGLTNSGDRTAFARIIVLYTGKPNVAEHVPVDIRPASGVVIARGESQQARGASQLQVIVYWGEERTRQRLRCFEKISGTPHTCEGIHFTDSFVGEDPAFRPPDNHPISKEDVRLFDQTLRMCTIYVCSPRIRPRPSLVPESLERSLQPEDTFRERTAYKPMIPDQTLRQ